MTAHARESGQAMIETALILLVLILLCVGVIDVGFGFFQYNAVAGLARDSSRWASVVGGTCALPNAVSTSDFCDENGASTSTFWSQAGNTPIQGAGVACPSFATTPADYYQVSNYSGSGATTIVGTIASHFDSSSSSTNFISRNLVGFNLTKLKVCVAVTSTTLPPVQGDAVSVTVYYPFTPATSLFTKNTIPLIAISRYEVE